MKQIPLDKLQASTLAERQHGVIVVREQARIWSRGISAAFLLAWQGPRIRTLDLVRGDLRSPLRRNRGRAMA
ncbi:MULTISPECIES: hypothetical protein [unclassified Inquilinus]|uniref:hypothetical protein n=1 Tax=unclassified Inquilinus TaxID=2645927 RepID=UPI003F920733